MYKGKLCILADHELVGTGSKSEQHKGCDTDIYSYDEKNAEGQVIARYVIRDSMSIYLPQPTTVSFTKYDLDRRKLSRARHKHNERLHADVQTYSVLW